MCTVPSSSISQSLNLSISLSLSLSLSLNLSAAVNPATCNTSINQQTIISTAAIDEAMEDDELIVVVPEKKHRIPPFIGTRGQKDWTHRFTGLNPSAVYRIQLEFASLTKVGSILYFLSR